MCTKALKQADLDSNIKLNLGDIGYWNISISCLDYTYDTDPEVAEQFIWEATITQDGYRCKYIESDSLIKTAILAIEWATKYKYTSDREIWS